MSKDILWESSEDIALWEAGRWPLIGTDEVGRGPLAGPVVAAAVALPPNDGLEGLRDSKAATARQRQRLVPQIQDRALAWAVVEACPDVIAERNILGASLWAMAEAVNQVVTALHADEDEAVVCVDGHQLIPQQLLWTPEIEQLPMVKGDSRSRAIAAAAILAKEHRDALMVSLDKRYPMYGFASHKGYPTAAHMEALERYGPCPAHRVTFAPVARLLSASEPKD